MEVDGETASQSCGPPSAYATAAVSVAPAGSLCMHASCSSWLVGALPASTAKQGGDEKAQGGRIAGVWFANGACDSLGKAPVGLKISAMRVPVMFGSAAVWP